MDVAPPTLRHLPVLRAFYPPAVMEPDDGRVRQTGHFALKHRLFSLDHIQVVERFDEIGHGESLHLVLWDLGLLGDGWHLLQFGPGSTKRRGEWSNAVLVKRLRLPEKIGKKQIKPKINILDGWLTWFLL